MIVPLLPEGHLAHHLQQLVSIGISITDCIGTIYGWGLHIEVLANMSYEHLVLISWISVS